MTRRPFVNDGLRREDFTEDRIARLMEQYAAAGVLTLLPAEEREASRHEMLAQHPAGEDALERRIEDIGLYFGRFREIFTRLDIDIERVEKQPARWGVG